MTIADRPVAACAALASGEGLTWEVGPFRVRLRTRLTEIVEALVWMYGAFPAPDGDVIADVEVCVATTGPTGRRVSIWVDGEKIYDRVPRRQAVPMLEWALNVTVFQRPHQYFMLHSGVVERGGRALLLPGLAGSGKSTLSAALMHRGWRLLSDEVAVVRPADGRVVPVPRPVSLKEASIDRIAEFAPDARIGPRWHGTIKGTIAHLLPSAGSVARAAETAVPAWIVFPNFVPRSSANLRPVARGSALMRCAENGFNYSVLGATGFETLADLVDGCACSELVFADLESALGLLEGATGSAGRPPIA